MSVHKAPSRHSRKHGTWLDMPLPYLDARCTGAYIYFHAAMGRFFGPQVAMHTRRSAPLDQDASNSIPSQNTLTTELLHADQQQGGVRPSPGQFPGVQHPGAAPQRPGGFRPQVGFPGQGQLPQGAPGPAPAVNGAPGRPGFPARPAMPGMPGKPPGRTLFYPSTSLAEIPCLLSQ